MRGGKGGKLDRSVQTRSSSLRDRDLDDDGVLTRVPVRIFSTVKLLSHGWIGKYSMLAISSTIALEIIRFLLSSRKFGIQNDRFVVSAVYFRLNFDFEFNCSIDRLMCCKFFTLR